MEKFTRKQYFQDPEMVPNARPQSTVKGTLDDEELGSLVQFKVRRHCRE